MWDSRYALRDDGQGLSPEGVQDCYFDRNSYQRKVGIWGKNAAKLMQSFIVDSSSPGSKAILELKVEAGGYAALKTTMGNLDLWKLILATHLGVSGRAKQFSLKALLEWKQSKPSFAEDLA